MMTRLQEWLSGFIDIFKGLTVVVTAGIYIPQWDLWWCLYCTDKNQDKPDFLDEQAEPTALAKRRLFRLEQENQQRNRIQNESRNQHQQQTSDAQEREVLEQERRQLRERNQRRVSDERSEQEQHEQPAQRTSETQSNEQDQFIQSDHYKERGTTAERKALASKQEKSCGD